MFPRSIVPGLASAALVVTLVAVSHSVPSRRGSHIVHPRSGKRIVVPGADNDSILLHNGYRITPAGKHVVTGDMPLGGAFSPDGKVLAIANCGYNSHALHLISVDTQVEFARVPLGRVWNGVAWSPDGKRIYVSGGVTNRMVGVHIVGKSSTGAWELQDRIRVDYYGRGAEAIAGLALSSDGRTLYASDNSRNVVYAIDTASRALRSAVWVGDHPGVCRLSKDGSRLYVALWGASAVAVVDVVNADRAYVLRRIGTGSHPNDLAVSSDGRMFVSCGNSDTVSVVDLKTNRVEETVCISLTPQELGGETPNALALTPDGRTLYVANADSNAVCVVDVSERGGTVVSGFIPTGWYPTAVLAAPNGRYVVIGSGKGLGTGPNPARIPIAKEFPSGFPYIGRLLGGMVSFVSTPDAARLAVYTRKVAMDCPYRAEQVRRAFSRRNTAIPTEVGGRSPIKYVLYIIKENRTYDQVFGDISSGNGDPNLTLFGRDVTPNQHALAEEYVLLDNLYCNSEVSADGHPWSTAAYVTDFVQRSWVLGYSGKGLLHPTDSVCDPGHGFIWQACARKGIPYRTYGEYSWHRSVRGHSCLEFVGKAGAGMAPFGRDFRKADVYIREFKEFEAKHAMPRFMVMSLGENHTVGTIPGALTPKAMVASNDLAVGKIVEAITHSSLWGQFAIFIIEDDAQNGPDHVDAHRTTGMVLSPYTRRRYVDSTMYTTMSMLRTMELILGLPPMTEHDGIATPMFESFTDHADLRLFTHLDPRVDLMARNPTNAYGSGLSSKLDFSDYDRADERTLNDILWHSIKGREVPMPPPVRTALVAR